MLVCFFQQSVKILCEAHLFVQVEWYFWLVSQSFIKIETLRGLTPTEIYSLLWEVCDANTLNPPQFLDGWKNLKERTQITIVAAGDNGVEEQHRAKFSF